MLLHHGRGNERQNELEYQAYYAHCCWWNVFDLCLENLRDEEWITLTFWIDSKMDRKHKKKIYTIHELESLQTRLSEFRREFGPELRNRNYTAFIAAGIVDLLLLSFEHPSYVELAAKIRISTRLWVELNEKNAIPPFDTSFVCIFNVSSFNVYMFIKCTIETRYYEGRLSDIIARELDSKGKLEFHPRIDDEFYFEWIRPEIMDFAQVQSLQAMLLEINDPNQQSPNNEPQAIPPSITPPLSPVDASSTIPRPSSSNNRFQQKTTTSSNNRPQGRAATSSNNRRRARSSKNNNNNRRGARSSNNRRGARSSNNNNNNRPRQRNIIDLTSPLRSRSRSRSRGRNNNNGPFPMERRQQDRRNNNNGPFPMDPRQQDRRTNMQSTLHRGNNNGIDPNTGPPYGPFRYDPYHESRRAKLRQPLPRGYLKDTAARHRDNAWKLTRPDTGHWKYYKDPSHPFFFGNYYRDSKIEHLLTCDNIPRWSWASDFKHRLREHFRMDVEQVADFKPSIQFGRSWYAEKIHVGSKYEVDWILSKIWWIDDYELKFRRL